MTTHSCVLPRKNPMDRGTRRATVHRVAVICSWARQKVMEWGAVSPRKQGLSWGKSYQNQLFWGSGMLSDTTPRRVLEERRCCWTSAVMELCARSHTDSLRRGAEDAVATYKEHRSCRNSWGKWRRNGKQQPSGNTRRSWGGGGSGFQSCRVISLNIRFSTDHRPYQETENRACSQEKRHLTETIPEEAQILK